MLSSEEIKETAFELAKAQLGSVVKGAVVEETVDFEGQKSLRVTILLKSRWSIDPPGGKLNSISSRLNTYLSEHGDSRFAYTHYMTSREFSELNDRLPPASRRRRAAG